MGTVDILNKIAGLNQLVIPHHLFPEGLPVRSFAEKPVNDSEAWLISCRHSFHPPASTVDLEHLTRQVPDLPDAFLEILSFSNGVNLFEIHYITANFDFYLPTYKIMNTDELLRVRAEQLDVFMSFAEFDDRYANVETLNYLAYCDLHNGNFLAVSLDAASFGTVFFLDHEYEFFPFGVEDTQDAYLPVASSIETWLQGLLATSGLCGLEKVTMIL